MLLVTQSFGRESEYKRVILSIWSYWLYHPTGRVLLFTDAPDYFSIFFKDMPVQYKPLTDEKLKLMRGSIDFLHRIKIAIIEEAFAHGGENLLYIDSDTFFIDNVNFIDDELAADRAFMHVREYRFDSLREMKLPAAKPFHAFLDLIESTSFFGRGGNIIPVSSQQYSWNAGVMAFHPSHRDILLDVYALTEQFYPKTENHASEQYAFSIVLQNNVALFPCDRACYHYWYRVKKTIVDSILEDVLVPKWATMNSDQKLVSVKVIVQQLQYEFENHHSILRDRAIQAFHENDFKKGYYWAYRTLLKKPFDFVFIKDVGYHTKKWLIKQSLFNYVA